MPGAEDSFLFLFSQCCALPYCVCGMLYLDLILTTVQAVFGLFPGFHRLSKHNFRAHFSAVLTYCHYYINIPSRYACLVCATFSFFLFFFS